MFTLGLILGITICIFLLVGTGRYSNKINRSLDQVHSKMMQKGSIIESNSEELQDWLDSLKK